MELDSELTVVEKSSRASPMEMGDSSGQDQFQLLNEVETHLQAIQNLVQGRGQQNLQQLRNQLAKESTGSGNSACLSAISRYVDKIRKVIQEEKHSALLTSSSLASLPQKITNQREGSIMYCPSSREKALANNVVLRTIINYLDTRYLLNARLVAKKWQEEATIQLLSKELYRVTFKWDETTLKFRNDIGSLEEFTQNCTRDPLRKFPCSEFQFHFVNVLNSKTEEAPADLSDFLSKYGHHIKGLYLQSTSNSASALKKIRQIIFKSTTNLRSLSLELPIYKNRPSFPAQGFDDEQVESSSDNGQQLFCSPLKELQELYFTPHKLNFNLPVLEKCEDLFRDILSSAPKLKITSDLYLCFTKEIVSFGKLRAVKSLKWDKDTSAVGTFAEFAQARPQLTTLDLNLKDFKYADALPLNGFSKSLELILKSSRETLKTLKLTGRLDLEVENFLLDVPFMQNLEEVQIWEWSSFENGRGRILPRGFSLRKSLSNLKSLSFHGIRFQYEPEFGYDHDEVEDESKIDNPFDHRCNSSSTVEKLILTPKDYSFDADRLSQAPSLYPNVRILQLELTWSLELLPKILDNMVASWTDSALEELQITVAEVIDDINGNSFINEVDHHLTGFDRDTCKKLLNRPGSGQLYRGEKIKRRRSFLDMKKLKLFKLTAHAISVPYFSRVSVIHTFEPMRRRQNLKVVIDGVDLEEMVQRGNFWSPEEEEEN